jgi:group I intron endonuclease
MNSTVQESSGITTNIDKKSVKNECCGIYGLKNKVNNKWYVGQSVDVIERWRKYKTGQCKSQPKIYRAIIKYGYNDFEEVLIEECENVDWILDYREAFWIRNLNSVKNGYNILEGGTGSKLDEAAKQKIREKATGRKASEQTKEKLRAIWKTRIRKPKKVRPLKMYLPRKGYTWTDAQKKHLSEKHKGRKFTASWKLNISRAKKGIPTKKHSVETKEKMKQLALLREQLKRERRLTNQKVLEPTY